MESNSGSTLKIYDLHYLKKITKNFSEDQILGRGGFGIVYKGEQGNGKVVAVKKLITSMAGLDDKQFMNEVQHTMDICHPNVVKLEGYCYQTAKELTFHRGGYIFAEEVYRLLCTEYMPNGSLRNYISDESSGLDWHTRYNIIDGICKGLYCLHEGREGTPILHLDLKPSNILLDRNMTPKITDFGLSRLFGEGKTHTFDTGVTGTGGYMAPEYIDTLIISKKSDIFSLGVIIIETVTGHRKYPEGTSNEEFMEVYEKWRTRLHKKSNEILAEEECRQVDQCIELGLRCMEKDPKGRPNIREVVEILKEISFDGEEESWKLIHQKLCQTLDTIVSGSPEQSMEAMKAMCDEINKWVPDTMPEYITEDVDRLASCLTLMVRKTFSSNMVGSSSMHRKITLYTVEQFFQIRHLVCAMEKGTLQELVTEMLIWLSAEEVVKMDDGSELFNFLDVAVFKILEDNTDGISLFVILINLLRPLDPSRCPSCTPLEHLIVKNNRFSELVVKFIHSRTEMEEWDSQGIINDFDDVLHLDIDLIFQSILAFFEPTGMEGIHIRDNNGDVVIVVVFLILYKLVKHASSNIAGHLSMLPINAESPPIILKLIDQCYKGKITEDVDRLASCLTSMVQKTFSSNMAGSSYMHRKVTLYTVEHFFQIRHLVYAVKKGALQELVAEMLIWLSAEEVVKMDDGSQLFKSLDVVVFKILEDNVDRISLFVIIINLLRPLDQSRCLSCTPLEHLIVKNNRFSELVVKFILSETEMEEQDSQCIINDFYDVLRLDINLIFQSIHAFFEPIGMERIQIRDNNGDMVIAVVFLILYKLVKHASSNIAGHLSMVSINVESPSIILKLIYECFQGKITKDVDRLASCLTSMVRKTFSSNMAGSSSMHRKITLYTVKHFFQIRHLVCAVEKGSLQELVTEMLIWLSEEEVVKMDDGSQLFFSLDVAVFKILEDNTDRISLFVILINLLRPLDQSRCPSCTPLEHLIVKNNRFSELVVKFIHSGRKMEERDSQCIINDFYDVLRLDIDPIFQSIHVFFESIGMEGIRDNNGDVVIAVVLHILYKLVKHASSNIAGHLSMVPINAESPPIILKHIDQCYKGKITEDVDKLASCLTWMVRKTFSSNMFGSSSMHRKITLYAVEQFFQIRHLVCAVEKGALQELVTQMLIWLSAEEVVKMDDGSKLFNSLDVAMFKILEDNVDIISLFVVLINLLRPLVLSRGPSYIPLEHLMVKNNRFSELVVKFIHSRTEIEERDSQCIINNFYDVLRLEIDPIFQSIHAFFESIGMEGIRDNNGDVVIAVVLLILYKLVKHASSNIAGHLSMVPINAESPPIILKLIDQCYKGKITEDVDKLASCLTWMVRKTFSSNMSGSSSMHRKITLYAVEQFFQIRHLVCAVEKGALQGLVTQMLIWLSAEEVVKMDDGSKLFNSLDVAMFKILEDNVEIISLFVILINLLRPLDLSRCPSYIPLEHLIVKNNRFSELVVKFIHSRTEIEERDSQCIINNFYDVLRLDIDPIFQSIHAFFESIGMEGIRDNNGDVVIAVVLLILYKLVKHPSSNIAGHLSMVPINDESPPIILKLIDQCYKIKFAVPYGKITEDVDKLASCMTWMVRKTFSSNMSGSSSMHRKITLYAVEQFFQISHLVCAVEKGALQELVTEMLIWLSAEEVVKMDDGSQLFNSLEVAVFKILEDNSDKISLFLILINLLRPLDPSRCPPLEHLLVKNNRFSELVMKFIYSRTEMEEGDPECIKNDDFYDVLPLDLDLIFQSIHAFFEPIGIEGLQIRGNNGDVVIDVVFLILYKLVKHAGSTIAGRLSMVPLHAKTSPIILKLIDQCYKGDHNAPPWTVSKCAMSDFLLRWKTN